MSNYSYFPSWKFFATGLLLTLLGLCISYIPVGSLQFPTTAELLLKGLSTLLFYVGLLVLTIYLLSICARLVFAGLAISPEENMQSLNKVNLKWNWAVTGFIILLFQFCIEQLPLPASASDNSVAQEAISNITAPMFYIGLGLIVASIIYTNFQEKVVSFWRTEVLTKLRENIDEVSEKYISAVKADTLEEAIKQADTETTSNHLDLCVANIYGDHCTKDKGLFNTLKAKLFPYLQTDKVHRSNYIKKITIDESKGKNKWDETCEFQLHCIKLDSDYCTVGDDDSESYELKYNANMKVAGSPEKVQDFWDLEIKIYSDDNDSGVVIFNSSKALKFNSSKDGIEVVDADGAEIELDYDLSAEEFSFRFSKEIELKKAFTKVVIKETSHLPENYFTLSTKEPSCGMDIDIHLPTGWSFEEHNAFNPDRAWSISTHPSNRLYMHNSGWVLPGIVMNCRWKSNQQPDLELQTERGA